jgi:hypothetical protein
MFKMDDIAPDPTLEEAAQVHECQRSIVQRQPEHIEARDE